MVKKNRIYLLFVCIGLLLFTQVVVPYLHHHSERVHPQGITEGNQDHCLICSLDIAPADLILPVLFAWTALVLRFTVSTSQAPVAVYRSVPLRNGRAPPLF